MERLFCTAPILLHVIDFLDLLTLLNLRLLNKPTNGLISRYESSIAKNIAKNLCPDDDIAKLADFEPTALTDLIYFVRLDLVHRLAIKAVASDQYVDFARPVLKGISAHDDLGDEIRQKVQNGFMVISKISQVHAQVFAGVSIPEAQRQKGSRGKCSRTPMFTHQAVEEVLWRRWLQLMESLPVEDVVDFHLAFWCVRGKTAFDHQARGKGTDLWSAVQASEPERINWLAYHLIRNGLHMIDRLWSDKQSIVSKAKAKIKEDAKEKTRPVIALEIRTSKRSLGNSGASFDHLLRYLSIAPWGLEAAGSYYESTFACRIGPYHEDLSAEEIVVRRRNAVWQSVVSRQGNQSWRRPRSIWKNRYRP